MKKILSLLLLIPGILLAQQKVIKHTVTAKESYSSIGRLYNINGRTIAEFNKLNYEKGLSIGQVLNVPVVSSFKKPATFTPPNVIVPVAPPAAPKGTTALKHIVGKKETLYGISKKYNVSIADIKKWNKLTTDGLTEGVEIIVGYGNTTPINNTVITTEKTEPVVVQQETKKAPAPVVIPTKTTAATVIPKETGKPVVINNSKNNTGIFKEGYNDTGKEEKGTAGIFKSTSGWEDGKYYCLHNTATQGTIIKISNAATGKFIYAKVLDGIPDLKQNADLLVRISNAAADAIGAAGDNFECIINY